MNFVSDIYGAAECTQCFYPLTTLTEAKTACDSVVVGLGANTLIILFSSLVAVFLALLHFGGEKKFLMLVIIALPSLNFLTDLAYILTVPYYSYATFAAVERLCPLPSYGDYGNNYQHTAYSRLL